MKTKLAVLASLSLFATAAIAEPAPWHLWQHKLDGKTYCAQTSPGEGWEQNEGPFSNARCRKLQTRPAGAYQDNNLTGTRFTRESQTDIDRKNRLIGLMAVFVSARANQ